MTLDCFESLLSTRLPKLLDVAGEGLSKHLGVETGELLEDILEHEFLSQGKRVDARQGDVRELGAFGCENIVVSDVAVVDSLLGNHDAFLLEILSAGRQFKFVLVVEASKVALE